MLVHVEVQGDHDVEFPERMFVSNHRIFDRFRRPVVSLAVLSDESPSWRPGYFGWEIWECAMGLRFPVAKLRDYNERCEALEASRNPFSTVVLAHLRTRATRNDPESRLAFKLRLIRRLYESGYLRRDVVAVFRFIDWVMRLPESLEDELEKDLKNLEKEYGMPYVTRIERKGIELGKQQRGSDNSETADEAPLSVLSRLGRGQAQKGQHRRARAVERADPRGGANRRRLRRLKTASSLHPTKG